MEAVSAVILLAVDGKWAPFNRPDVRPDESQPSSSAVETVHHVHFLKTDNGTERKVRWRGVSVSDHYNRQEGI